MIYKTENGKVYKVMYASFSREDYEVDEEYNPKGAGENQPATDYYAIYEQDGDAWNEYTVCEYVGEIEMEMDALGAKLVKE